jgi:tryptophan 2-C-methyltransferase
VFSIRNLDDAYFASQDFILERTAEIIRHAAQCTSVPVILGGVGFSIAPEAVLQFTGADYGIQGDGEQSLPELLDALAAEVPVYTVSGVVFRTGFGGIVANPAAFWDPASAPTPSRRFLDHARYFAEGGQAGIETKRGCSNRCIYCVEPHAKGGCVRLRRPESVVEEIRDLLEQGVNVYHLCDSEFNLPSDHARAVCAAIENSGVAQHIRWYTYAYPKPFDVDLARAMARAGCAGVNFGVDHTVPAIIQGFGRNYVLDDLRNTAEACRAAGLAVMFDMLLGGPGETRETLARAIEDIRALPLDRIGLSCGARIYPNTPLASYVLQQGPVESNPNLHGVLEDNADFLRPIFYVEAGIGKAIHSVVSELVRGDARFLHTDPEQIDGNYNYNDNSVLSDAIRKGARGAYWDILRRLHKDN